MRKAILAITSAAAIGSLATTSASAMPIAHPAAPPSYVDQVGWVCNPWGRCWRRPNYYRPYGYYGYRYDDDAPPYYRYRRWDGYYDRPHYWGGSHRRWDDNDDD
jgi:hypothetical protein